MKQIAVEWLIHQIFYTADVKLNRELFEQAKEIEKKQIIDFAESYVLENLTCNYNGEPISLKEAKEYYNEQFKKK